MIRFCASIILAILLATALDGCATAVVGGTAVAADVAHDRRTVGTIVDDQAIKLKLFTAIHNQPDKIANAHIDVTCYDYVVLLTGEVPNASIRDWAADTAKNIQKVRKVYNELAIAPPSSLASRAEDTWITTKAKSSLFEVSGLPHFDPTRVKVVTERGVVYLMGLVTPAEAQATTSVIRHIDGVQKVVTFFEYIRSPTSATT